MSGPSSARARRPGVRSVGRRRVRSSGTAPDWAATSARPAPRSHQPAPTPGRRPAGRRLRRRPGSRRSSSAHHGVPPPDRRVPTRATTAQRAAAAARTRGASPDALSGPAARHRAGRSTAQGRSAEHRPAGPTAESFLDGSRRSRAAVRPRPGPGCGSEPGTAGWGERPVRPSRIPAPERTLVPVRRRAVPTAGRSVQEPTAALAPTATGPAAAPGRRAAGVRALPPVATRAWPSPTQPAGSTPASGTGSARSRPRTGTARTRTPVVSSGPPASRVGHSWGRARCPGWIGGTAPRRWHQ